MTANLDLHVHVTNILDEIDTPDFPSRFMRVFVLGHHANTLVRRLQLTPSDPDQIAASMQALAQSITTDERYIFGERPRPRLNTGDSQRPTLNKERFQKWLC